MLALMLGTGVITLMPRPTQGQTREGVKATIAKAPRYLRLMESWRWCGGLWKSGVIRSEFAGQTPADELQGVYETIAGDDALAPLRPLTRGAVQRAGESADKALDFIAGDMLRGGPDPGINIPISAALDRFAIRHRLCVVRSGAASVAQRVESKLARKVFSFAVPIMLRAGGERIEMLRTDLAAPLDVLRSAIGEMLDRVDADQTPAKVDQDRLTRAASAFAKAFDHWAAVNAVGDDENDERITTGYVSISGVVMPGDAVLRSSRAAVRAIQGETRGDINPLESSRNQLLAIVVREMSVQPA